jgi:GNAT superfamily N-acetyltransferase
LLEAVEEADRRNEHHDADDCAEELADQELDLERDTLLVLDGGPGRGPPGGRCAHRAAAGIAPRRRRGRAPSYRRRGIGTALMAVARLRADVPRSFSPAFPIPSRTIVVVCMAVVALEVAKKQPLTLFAGLRRGEWS